MAMPAASTWPWLDTTWRCCVRKEQTEAAKEVGVTELFFLGYGDGRVQVTLQLRADISAVIRRVRPRVVIAQSPERILDRIYASHPDHLAAGEATLCAVYPDAATRSRSPSCSKRASSRGRSTRCGSWAAATERMPSTSPRQSTARSRR